MDYMHIILTVVIIVLGYLVSYFKTRSDLVKKVADFIEEAEQEYADYTKAGGKKFDYVVGKLYDLVPAPLKPILSKAVIGQIVQATFNAIEAYAKAQLDKLKV